MSAVPVGRLVGATLFLAGLAGCAEKPPPPPPPTLANVTLTTSADVNASAPVAIRIYQLVSHTDFDGSLFFPIFDGDAATLKDDLVKREELLLAPGQTRTLKLMPEERVHSLGFFAAYRDYQHATWKTSVDLPPHQTSAVTLTAGAAGLTVSLTRVDTPKPAP